jgi:hypothetical protein
MPSKDYDVGSLCRLILLPKLRKVKKKLHLSIANIRRRILSTLGGGEGTRYELILALMRQVFGFRIDLAFSALKL